MSGEELSFVELSGVNLNKVDLSNANLVDVGLQAASLQETHLKNAIFPKQILEVQKYRRLNLERVNLSKALYDEHTQRPMGFSPANP